MVKVILVFSIIFLNCCKSNFTIKKIPIYNNLKLNGIYFRSSTVQFANGVSIYFLYTNGVYFHENTSFQNLDSGITYYKNKILQNVQYKTQPIEKASWGVFRIINDEIILEKPEPSQGYPLIRSAGKIINDSTFYIDNSKEEYKEIKKYPKLFFHFMQLDFKIDSTNKFVN